MPPVYDVIVIGSGPAGLTAAIYATRAGLKTLVIAGTTAGGQLMITTDVENYPGFPAGVQGPELMELWRKQAERFKADFVDDNLSKVCKTVSVVHRRDAFRASKIMQERLLKTSNVKVLWDSEVVDVLGDAKVEGVRIRNKKTGKTSDLKVHGLFLAIGHSPATQVFEGQLKLEKGYIALRPHDGLATATSVDGVFAAGDVHDFRYRQAVTAAGFGSMAALDAERWLGSHA